MSNQHEYPSADQLAEYKEAFDLFDVNAIGSIDASRLGVMLRSLGCTPTEAELHDMIVEADTNGSNRIEFPDFVNLMQRKHREHKRSSDDESIQQAFKAFDREGTGLLPLHEAMRIMNQVWDDELSPGEWLEAMVECKDAVKGHDGLADDALRELLRMDILHYYMNGCETGTSEVCEDAEALLSEAVAASVSVEEQCCELQVFVVRVTGEPVLSLTLSSSSTVSQLQQQISHFDNVPTWRQTLLLEGEPMSLESTLVRAGLSDGSTVTLVTRPELMIEYEEFLRLAGMME
eukprot:TRINITY_DN41757_c0_g1_i1.p1 TRINITY_DN41757_c0_g1~~TRINITY_DN41757_c0_g1_i1.p1  ORF type:complete len:303 (+),score=46.80 TRINITY_DN41757_c0_g1_i1:41-910(+)